MKASDRCKRCSRNVEGFLYNNFCRKKKDISRINSSFNSWSPDESYCLNINLDLNCFNLYSKERKGIVIQMLLVMKEALNMMTLHEKRKQCMIYLTYQQIIIKFYCSSFIKGKVDNCVRNPWMWRRTAGRHNDRVLADTVSLFVECLEILITLFLIIVPLAGKA